MQGCAIMCHVLLLSLDYHAALWKTCKSICQALDLADYASERAKTNWAQMYHLVLNL